MQFFHREPFAQSTADWEDFIPAIPESSFVDDNSPDSEVHFDDNPNDRRRSIYLDFHNNAGEAELEIVAGYNSIRRELLNEALKEKTKLHGEIKTLAVTMATQNARAHALFFLQNGFVRSADRSRSTWTYTCDLAAHKLKKKERKPRATVLDVTSKPVRIEDIRPRMTVDELGAKQDALDALRLKIQQLEGQYGNS